MTDLSRRIPPLLHPILFATFPLLSLFAQNQSDVELSALWWPLALCLMAALLLCGVFMLITKDLAKAGALTSLIAVAFFYFGPFSEKLAGWGLGDWGSAAIWLALFAVAFVAVARTRRSLVKLTLVVTFAAAVLALPQAAGIAIYHANHPSVAASDPRIWPTALKPPPRRGAQLPDVYFLIPDDYARADVLRRYFHYSDSAFLGALRKRRFVISGQARSPYSDSESNIAATLNMDYLSGFPRLLGKGSEDVRPVKRVIQDNRAARLLRPLGYRYVHFDTDEVTFAAGNPGISPLAPPDSFPNLWLRKSLLRLVGGPLGFDERATNDRFRTSVRSGFRQLGAVASKPSPKFVVFHTLLPHDPYVFGAHGQAVTFPGHSDEDLASNRGRSYYLQQLQFVKRKLLEATDVILARSKTPPVIVIQSDEGFQANSEPFGEAAMQDIRVKGLIALYLPGHGRARVPQPPNTVNTLRFIFNRYLGTHYRMLRSASYPEGDLPYQFEEMRVK